MSVEANALARFKVLAALPDECRLERRILQGKLCLLVDCPDSAIAERLWRNQYTLVDPAKALALAERSIILHKGRVWHPAYRDLW